MKANDLQGTNPFTSVNRQQISRKEHPISPSATTHIPGGSRLTNRCLTSLPRGEETFYENKKDRSLMIKKKLQIPIKPKVTLTRGPVLFFRPYHTDKGSLTGINMGC